jgi:crotonobetainyl-CoA:carnitine CoA-transferase CaiB-like acyl-CoA transferase
MTAVTSAAGEGRAMPVPTPLAGVTVVEALSAGCPLALRLSASFAGRIAADLGARVIKLEPAEGDPVRRLPPFDDSGRGTLFAFLNAGKASVLANDVASVRVMASADAVIRDDGSAGLAPDSETIEIVLSMLAGSGAAAAGPQTEFTILALGGMLDIVGDPQRSPLRLGGHQLAYAAGLAAYTGLVAGLLRRPAREIVRVALLDVAVWINWKSVASVVCIGVLSSRAGRAAEWSALRCADGYFALVHQPPDWPALCRLCGDARLDSPLFADPTARQRNAALLADIVEESLGPLTRAELQTRAMALRLPLGPVWDIADLHRDPQVLARNFLTQIGGEGASVRMPRLPVLWNGTAFPAGPVPVPVQMEPAR